MRRPTLIMAVACAGLPALALAAADPNDDYMSSASMSGTTPDMHSVPSVVINGGRPSALPTQIPTTIEGISGEQIERASMPPTARTRSSIFPA